jgi:16S rRNA (guanine527-N7)-methyltransferase
LVLAIALPAASVCLVESNRRKSAFIGRAIEVSGVDNAVVVNDRAETWGAGSAAQDVVTARALAPLNVVAEYAAPMLRVGGTLVAWTGKREPDVEARAARAGELLGLSGPVVFEVVPFAASAHRHLHIMSKVRATPATFPRRPGVARKRPLGLAGTTV